MINSEFHEVRLLSLYILVLMFKKTKTEKEQIEIYEFYIKHTKQVNNWDLVDSSAHYILGPYLMDKEKSILYDLAKSDNLWERCIAMISTFHFIKNMDFNDALKIAKILLHDHHDLIHKAVAWMLREIGNRNRDVEEKYLIKYYMTMPRTMLRYAIETFPKEERNKYLKGTR